MGNYKKSIAIDRYDGPVRGRWRRRALPAQLRVRPSEVPLDIAASFLELDDRQRAVQRDVASERALHPDSPIMDEWRIVEQRSHAATAAYLALTEDCAALPNGTQQAQRLIAEAASAIDAFHRRHRGALDGAASAIASAIAEADSASAAAQRLRDRLNGPDARWISYPSVQDADRRFRILGGHLQTVRQQADLAAMASVTAQLVATSSELAAALDAAPHQAERARRALSSVRTRLAAADTRAAGMAATLSVLLREFHGDSSADLVGNSQASQDLLEQVDALLQAASTELREDRPEAALDCTARARTVLGAAEELIDAPLDRLTQLRGVRSDPGIPERGARFRLRDAQRLAVSQGATAEWGTVLDAQRSRIDQIVAALDAPNPDYWRYRCDLDAVEVFINRVVGRIREQASQ